MCPVLKLDPGDGRANTLVGCSTEFASPVNAVGDASDGASLGLAKGGGDSVSAESGDSMDGTEGSEGFHWLLGNEFRSAGLMSIRSAISFGLSCSSKFSPLKYSSSHLVSWKTFTMFKRMCSPSRNCSNESRRTKRFDVCSIVVPSS